MTTDFQSAQRVLFTKGSMALLQGFEDRIANRVCTKPKCWGTSYWPDKRTQQEIRFWRVRSVFVSEPWQTAGANQFLRISGANDAQSFNRGGKQRLAMYAESHYLYWLGRTSLT